MKKITICPGCQTISIVESMYSAPSYCNVCSSTPTIIDISRLIIQRVYDIESFFNEQEIDSLKRELSQGGEILLVR